MSTPCRGEVVGALGTDERCWLAAGVVFWVMAACPESGGIIAAAAALGACFSIGLAVWATSVKEEGLSRIDAAGGHHRGIFFLFILSLIAVGGARGAAYGRSHLVHAVRSGLRGARFLGREKLRRARNRSWRRACCRARASTSCGRDAAAGGAVAPHKYKFGRVFLHLWFGRPAQAKYNST